VTRSRGVGRGKGGGRPTDYNEEHCVRVAKGMAKLGATEREVAAALGVSEKTVQRWSHEHPRFRLALKPNKKAADDRTEHSLFKRANGYSYDAEELVPYDHVTEYKETAKSPARTVKVKKVLRVPIVKHVPPDSTAMIFWLKNRRRETWRDYKATEITTPPGQPLHFKNDGPPEAELIGQYYRRLAAIAAGEGADPGPHPGVGEAGQEPEGSGSGSETDPG
jgi:Homeodomain-like domain